MTLQIMLAEDNPVDILITKEALKRWEIENDLHVVHDGAEALLYLRRRGIYEGAARPDLILLDLNLPKKNGVEVLSEIRKDPHLSNIIVVIVTTSDAVADVQKCYKLGAKLCISKPVDLEEYVAAIIAIQKLC